MELIPSAIASKKGFICSSYNFSIFFHVSLTKFAIVPVTSCIASSVPCIACFIASLLSIIGFAMQLIISLPSFSDISTISKKEFANISTKSEPICLAVSPLKTVKISAIATSKSPIISSISAFILNMLIIFSFMKFLFWSKYFVILPVKKSATVAPTEVIAPKCFPK